MTVRGIGIGFVLVSGDSKELQIPTYENFVLYSYPLFLWCMGLQ